MLLGVSPQKSVMLPGAETQPEIESQVKTWILVSDSVQLQYISSLPDDDDNDDDVDEGDDDVSTAELGNGIGTGFITLSSMLPLDCRSE